ncbi:TerD family protein [Streptomyces sp. NPDC023723]|uniref:TerD family protein n=1 Tax=Streptomyces sp. NPDC023723 TaxID=3154323 RepID=UPI0034097DA4
MTAELVRGQNHPLSRTCLEVRVSAGTPVVAAVTLGDADGSIPGVEWVAHPGAPALPGLEVPRRAAADHRLTVDLDAVPDTAHRVDVLLALPDADRSGPDRFGAVAAPFVAVTDPDGAEIASYTLTGLDAETAVIALEFYRRQGAWKVRAIGQGYAGGFTELLTDRRLPEARSLAGAIQEAVARDRARSVPQPPPPADSDSHRARQTATPGTAADRGGVAPRSTDLVPPASAIGPQTDDGPGQPGPQADDGPGQPGLRAGDGPGQPGLRAGDGPGQQGLRTGDGPGQPGVRPDGGPRQPGPSGQPGPGIGDATTGTTGSEPIDYSHPRRQSTAPPPPASAGPAPVPGQSPPGAPPRVPDRPVPAAPALAPGQPVPAPPPGQPAPPVAGDATGWSMDERLYNQVWGMFEDLARSVAACRSAVDFADSRREKELDQALSDPSGRVGRQGDAARETARARYEELVTRAREVLDRDVAQLAAESQVVETALPPAYARWDSPAWHGYRVPVESPMALRLGDLHLPEADPVRIPMLVRLPLERGLWIDSGRAGPPDGSFADSHESFADSHEPRDLALDVAVAHAARLLAVHPPGEFTVEVVDAAGSGARALAPLLRSGVLAAPPAVGAAGVADVLARLTQRVDLVQMAVRGGAADALPPGFDTSQRLLIVNDFPHGFDDRAVNQLRYLADQGPSSGVHLMMVADREDSAGYGPLLDPLWRALLRLTPVADDHLADPWVGHAWIYEPPLVPPGSQVLRQVLAQVAAACG